MNLVTTSTVPSTSNGQNISDIEMGEHNQPTKPPRRKISRCTAVDDCIELEVPINQTSVSFVGFNFVFFFFFEC